MLERVKPANQASSLTCEPVGLGQGRGRRLHLAAGDLDAGGAERRPRPGGRAPALPVRHGGNYFYSTDRAEIKQAVEQLGYTDQGVVFYAAKAKAGCLIPVWSYYKDGVHRFVTGSADKAMLAAAGWRRDAVRFYVGRPAADPTFTFAVYPDTQQEVLRKSRSAVHRSLPVAGEATPGAGSAVRHPHR